jgi:hypothetical protein
MIWLKNILVMQEIKYKTRPCTVKPAHAVTSIKQSPALKGHIFLAVYIPTIDSQAIIHVCTGVGLWEWRLILNHKKARLYLVDTPNT